MSRLNVNSVNAHSGVNVNVTGSTDGGLIISASPSNDGMPVLQVHGSISASGELTCSNALFTGDVRIIGESVISASAAGGIFLGDANTDYVIFGADISSSIIPDLDDIYDLGTSSQEWKDIHIDGVGYIDAINQDDVTVVNQLKGDWNWTDDGAVQSLKVQSSDGNVGVKVADPNQELEVAGRISASLQLSVGGAGTLDGHITGSGNLVISGTAELQSLSATNITASGNLVVSGAYGVEVLNHITASGNISASGLVIANEMAIGSNSPGDGKLNVMDGKIIMTDTNVAHGITNHIQTDAYGDLGPIHGTRGGLLVNGTSDQESADARSLTLRGLCNDTHTDTVPVVELYAAKRSGTAIQALAAAETVLQVQNYTTTLATTLGDGKLGLGTTTPTEALQVAGNISSSGFISTLSHITASGNISSSGTVYSETVEIGAGNSIVNGNIKFNGGIVRPLKSITADTVLDATLGVTADAGKTIVLNKADGATVTLPAAAGTGNVYDFYVGTAITSNSYILRVADATDTFIGAVHMMDADDDSQTSVSAKGTDDTLTLNGGTTGGGLLGDTIKFTDIATNKYVVQGNIIVPAGSNPADPFSATVS